MAHELVFAIGGMAVLAAGVWRTESAVQRASRVIALLLCLCGIAIIAIAAARAGSNWSLRFAVLGTYSGSGGLLGSTIANLSAKRRAGAILASLGMAATTGFKIVSAIAIPAGILSVVMQFFDSHRPGSLILLVGQALLFVIFGIQAVLMARARWSLADQGIVGPNVFVPWQQVSACDWQDTNTLGITTRPGFRGARRLTLHVASEVRERAAAILASKIPA